MKIIDEESSLTIIWNFIIIFLNFFLACSFINMDPDYELQVACTPAESDPNLLCEGIKVWIRHQVLNTEYSILEFFDNLTKSFLKVI